jgi:hypothetical protein
MRGAPRSKVNAIQQNGSPDGRIGRNDGVIMDQALLELIEREGKPNESEWIDEVLRSFSNAPAGRATGWAASVIIS